MSRAPHPTSKIAMNLTMFGNSRLVMATFLLFVSMIAMLPSASSIRCYQCNSFNDPHCDLLKVNSTIGQSYLRDCNTTLAPPNAELFCRKMVQTLLAEGKRRVIRKCGYEKAAKDCYHYDNDVHSELVCQCFGEACNGANAPRPLIGVFAAITLVLLFAR